MKYFYSLLLLFFVSMTFGQEIARLDSIIYEDLDNGDVYPLEFTYDEDDRLIFLSGLDEGALEIGITYKDNGDYDTWALDNIDFISVDLNFVYDDQNELDSVSGSYESYGYDVTVYADVTSENGFLTQVTFGEDYGGYPFIYTDKIITYNSEEKIDSITELDVFYYTGEASGYFDYIYEGDKLSKRTYTDILYPSEGYTDSIGFDAEGKTETHTIVYNDTNSEDSYQTTYMESAPFLDEEFIGPFDFFYMGNLLFDFENYDILFTLMNNDRPTTHFTNIDGAVTKATWYYTLLVNNKETEIPAQPMSVQPNPASDFLQINLEDEVTKIEIYSMAGDLVKSLVTNEKTVNLQDLYSGSYIVIATSVDGKNYFSKIIKN